MEQQQNITQRYWIGSAVCCFLLVALGGLSLIIGRPHLTAVLSTVAFLVVFVVSGILYLLKWRRIIKAMWVVICVFFFGVVLYWWQTRQFIGVLPSLLVTLLIWQNGRLGKILQ